MKAIYMSFDTLIKKRGVREIKVLVGVLVVIIGLVLSWFFTGAVIWLICKCFSLQFSWKIATGIWLILMLIKCGKSEIAGNSQ